MGREAGEVEVEAAAREDAGAQSEATKRLAGGEEGWLDIRRASGFRPVPGSRVRRPMRVCGRVEWRQMCNSMPVLEGEAALYGLRHLARCVRHHGSRAVVLGDSLPPQ